MRSKCSAALFRELAIRYSGDIALEKFFCFLGFFFLFTPDISGMSVSQVRIMSWLWKPHWISNRHSQKPMLFFPPPISAKAKCGQCLPDLRKVIMYVAHFWHLFTRCQDLIHSDFPLQNHHCLSLRGRAWLAGNIWQQFPTILHPIFLTLKWNISEILLRVNVPDPVLGGPTRSRVVLLFRGFVWSSS